MASLQKKLKLLFITDPLANFDLKAETTLYLMEEAKRRSHKIFVAEPKDISAHGQDISVKAKEIQLKKRGKNPWHQVLSTKTKPARSFDTILLRKDPPFDLQYLNHLYLLELAAAQTYCMNHPRGVLLGNEKLLALKFPDLIPETLVSASKKELLQFLEKSVKGLILKPIGEAGGRGIFILQKNMPNLQIILEMATANFTKPVIVQTYLPQAAKGDKRILLMGDEVLGAFTRKPAQGEHRANLHVGGQARAASITKQDQKIITVLLPTLKELGLDFVGLDVIDGHLIEINVTSPMGIHEINQSAKIKSEKRVLDFIEAKVRAKVKVS